MSNDRLKLNIDELVEESTTDSVDNTTPNEEWEVSDDSSDTIIPLSEEAINDGIKNYYEALLNNTTDEDIANIIKYVDEYETLCNEFETHINESFENLADEVTPELIKTYRFPVEDERHKNFYEKVNPVLSFLVENEKIDKSVLDKAHAAFEKGYVASLLGCSLYSFNPNEEMHISEELSKAAEHTVYQLLSFQLENSLRVLNIQRRNNHLTADFIDLIRTQVNLVLANAEDYLKFNQLNTDIVEENKAVINNIIDRFNKFVTTTDKE